MDASFSLLKEFTSEINTYVWAEDISIAEFEQGWNAVINKYNLSDNAWLSDLYAIRRFWIPAFFRDEAMVGMLRTTSRSEAENSFFNQFHRKGDTIFEFYLRFESAMEKQRHENAKLNHESLRSLPTTKTPLDIEKDAANVYTRAIFYDVQKEIKASCYDVKIYSLSNADGLKTLVVKEKGDEVKSFEVKHNVLNNDVDCSCKLFLRIGIQCRHVFLAFNHGDISKIPSNCLINRWRKNVEQFVSTVKGNYATQYSNATDTSTTIQNDI